MTHPAITEVEAEFIDDILENKGGYLYFKRVRDTESFSTNLVDHFEFGFHSGAETPAGAVALVMAGLMKSTDLPFRKVIKLAADIQLDEDEMYHHIAVRVPAVPLSPTHL